jgi:hypothetical protein
MMSGNSNNSPMLKAAGLWAKTSVKGGQYGVLSPNPGNFGVHLISMA